MINYIEYREKLAVAFKGSKDIMALDTTALGRAAVLCYIDGMTDKELIDRNVIEPLKKCDINFALRQSERFNSTIKNIDCIDITSIMQDDNNCNLTNYYDSTDINSNGEQNENDSKGNCLIREQNCVEINETRAITADLLNKIIYISDPIIVCESFEEMINRIASGDIGLMIDGAESFFVLSLRDYKIRGITEPPVSTVLRGPREGFVEDMKVNMTMLRRRFRTPDLVFDLMQIGKYSGTQIAIAYIDGVADNRFAQKENRKRD